MLEIRDSSFEKIIISDFINDIQIFDIGRARVGFALGEPRK
jgi:hypothetical protein